MSKSQRTKGAVFEREVCKRFSDAFYPHTFTRNIGQARDGGNDIDVGCLVVECKRRASLDTLRSWLAQASVAAVARLGRSPLSTGGMHIPIVVCREDGGESPMVLLGFEDFLHLAGDKVKASLPYVQTVENMG